MPQTLRSDAPKEKFVRLVRRAGHPLRIIDNGLGSFPFEFRIRLASGVVKDRRGGKLDGARQLNKLVFDPSSSQTIKSAMARGHCSIIELELATRYPGKVPFKLRLILKNCIRSFSIRKIFFGWKKALVV